MKKMIKHRMVNIFMVLMFTIVPFNAFAVDKWSETPDLNYEAEIFSMTNRSTTLNFRNTDIDFWAETPDLNKGNQDHGVEISIARKASNFYPKMYDETPDLR